MSKRSFSRPFTTFDEQISKLQERHLIIDDTARAVDVLQHINYYRLCSYWLPFQTCAEKHMFSEGTHFDDVVKLYEFDRALRLLVLDAIERIEVSVRTGSRHEFLN